MYMLSQPIFLSFQIYTTFHLSKSDLGYCRYRRKFESCPVCDTHTHTHARAFYI